MVEKRNWLQLKYYQYELNTGIYMLEPREKKIFSILSFLVLSIDIQVSD